VFKTIKLSWLTMFFGRFDSDWFLFHLDVFTYFYLLLLF